MVQWHKDLVALAAEHQLENDGDISRELSLMAIELDALELSLPDQNEALKQAILQLHVHRLSERCLTILQAIVGYYALPDQPRGQNEPIIGSVLAHQLKTSLIHHEVDIHSVKTTLVDLLATSPGDQS